MLLWQSEPFATLTSNLNFKSVFSNWFPTNSSLGQDQMLSCDSESEQKHAGKDTKFKFCFLGLNLL